MFHDATITHIHDGYSDFVYNLSDLRDLCDLSNLSDLNDLSDWPSDF